MMLRLSYIFLSVLAVSSVSDVVLAATLSVRAQAKRGSLTTQLLSDGYTLLMVLKPSVPGIETELLKQNVDGMRVVVTPLRGNASEVKVVMADPILQQKVKRTSSRVEIDITYQPREQNMRQRILERLSLPPPSSFFAGRFKSAEKLMRMGRLRDSLAEFKELTEEYELRSWAQLRLSDIALLTGNVRGACRRYDAVAEAYRVQASGMLAQLRKQVLGCGWRPEDRPDWDVMLERADRVSGRVGDYIRSEAIWSMNQVARTDEIDLVLHLLEGVAVKHRGMQKEITKSGHILVARALRLPKEPIHVARMCYRHRLRIHEHPDAWSLRFLCAQAFTDLDLLEDSIAEIQEVLKKPPKKYTGGMWNQRDGTAQALWYLAKIYQQMGDPDYVYATLVKYQKKFGDSVPEVIEAEPPRPEFGLDDLKIGRSLASLEARLVGLDGAVRAVVPDNVYEALKEAEEGY